MSLRVPVSFSRVHRPIGSTWRYFLRPSFRAVLQPQAA